MLRFLLVFVCSTVFAGATLAQVAPRPDETRTLGTRVPDVTLTSEDGSTFQLSALAGKPIIVSPIFTRCPFVCGQITESLRDALAEIGEPGVGYHVLTISFDPADDTEALRAYRERLSLPTGWKLAIADPLQRANLLDAIDFNYEPLAEGGFAHANVIAILTPALTVSGYVHGVMYEPEEVRAALEKAAEQVSLIRHYRPWILAVAIAAALATSLVLANTRRKHA